MPTSVFYPGQTDYILQLNNLWDASASGGIANGSRTDINVVSGNSWVINAGAVTYSKMQNVSATSRILARKTSGAGSTEECTLSDILDFVGSAAQGDILYRGSSGWVRLAAGTAGQYLQTAGASANPAWVSQPFDVTCFYPGVPTASVIVIRIPIARAVTLPTSLTGSVAKAGIAATAQTDFDLQKNGASVGTIRFAASGTIASFIAASPTSFAAGDLLSIIGPASPDVTLANIGFVIAGTR